MGYEDVSTTKSTIAVIVMQSLTHGGEGSLPSKVRVRILQIDNIYINKKTRSGKGQLA